MKLKKQDDWAHKMLIRTNMRNTTGKWLQKVTKLSPQSTVTIPEVKEVTTCLVRAQGNLRVRASFPSGVRLT